MIVADSSVWIAHYRGEDTEITRKLYYVGLEIGMLVGDIILLEVLRGERNAADARRMVPMLGVALVRCMVSGSPSANLADLIIGSYCIEHGHSLLHDDRDFEPMREHLGLRVI